jgi:hypothetical protein
VISIVILGLRWTAAVILLALSLLAIWPVQSIPL